MDSGIKPSLLCPSFISPPEVSLITVLCCICVLCRTKLCFTSPLLVQGKKAKRSYFCAGAAGESQNESRLRFTPPSSSSGDHSPHEEKLQDVTGSERFLSQ